MAPDSGAILGPLSLAGRCTAAQQKLQLWAMAEPSSPMPDVLEAFCSAAPRQLSLAGLMAADPGARRSELYAVEDYYSSVVSALCRGGGRGSEPWPSRARRCPTSSRPSARQRSRSCGTRKDLPGRLGQWSARLAAQQRTRSCSSEPWPSRAHRRPTSSRLCARRRPGSWASPDGGSASWGSSLRAVCR